MKNAVVVSGLQPGISNEKLEIYFQRRKNGGGDVIKVQVFENGTKAIIEFEDAGTVASVLQRSHRMHGKAMKVEKHEEARSKQIFKRVEARISSCVLQKSRLNLADLIQIGDEFSSVDITSRNGKFFVVSDSMEKLICFEESFNERAKQRSLVFVAQIAQKTEKSPMKVEESRSNSSKPGRSPIRRQSPEQRPSKMEQSPKERRSREPRSSEENQSPIERQLAEPGSSVMNQSRSRQRHKPEGQLNQQSSSSCLGTDKASVSKTILSQNQEATVPAAKANCLDSRFPQPGDGATYTQNVQTEGGGETVKRKFCFPEGKISISGDIITYPSYNCVVSLPATPAGKTINQMLETAFEKRKLFYIGKSMLAPGFSLQPINNMFGSNSSNFEVDLSPKLSEIKLRLQECGVSAPQRNTPGVKKSKNVPGTTVRIEVPPMPASEDVVISNNGARPKTRSSSLTPLRKDPSPTERRNSHDLLSYGSKSRSPTRGKENVDKCTVCHAPLSKQRTKRLSCKHVFHQRCVDRALQTKKECPYCKQPIQSGTVNAPYASSLPQSTAPPTPPAAWTNPIRNVDENLRMPNEDKCAICLDVISALPTKKLSCGHEFHQSCIDTELKLRGKCPYCSQPVNAPSTLQPQILTSSESYGLPLNPFFSPPLHFVPTLSVAGGHPAHPGLRLHGPYGLPYARGTVLVGPPMHIDVGSSHPSRRYPTGQFEPQPPNGTMTHRVDKQSLPGFESCSTIIVTYHIPGGIQRVSHPNPGTTYAPTHKEAYLPDNVDGRDLLRLLKCAFDAGLTFRVGRSGSTGLDGQVVWNGIPHKTNRQGGPISHGYPDPGYLLELRRTLAAKGIW